MKREEVERRVKLILATTLRLDSSEIKNTDRLVDDLDADSIDEAEILNDFDILYDLQISDDDCEGAAKWTVQDFIDLVERKFEERDNPKNK